MKRCFFTGLAMIAAVTMLAGSAWAYDQEFSGEWRTRAYINDDWDGDDDSDGMDYNAVDTRARLFYTLKLHEDLKLNAAVEVGDLTWGEHYDEANGDYADVGTDDDSFEIKHLYADFNWGPTNWKLGAQELVVARGFILWDDFYSANVTLKTGNVSTSFIWAKLREGWDDDSDLDFDFYGVYPTLTLGQTTVVPGLMWAHSGDLDSSTVDNDDHDSFYLSVDVDHSFSDSTSIWFTGIYKGGSETKAGADIDFSAYLFAFGGTTKIDKFEIHGQAFYASGDDDATDDEDNTFTVGNGDGYCGQSYYWAEILGYGWMDANYTPTGAPADQIGNVWAINIGTTINFTDKTSLILDLWKAELAEDNAYGETDLGIEFDARLSTQIVPDYLYVDVIFAYLFAGDAVSADGENDENPLEAGVYFGIYF